MSLRRTAIGSKFSTRQVLSGHINSSCKVALLLCMGIAGVSSPSIVLAQSAPTDTQITFDLVALPGDENWDTQYALPGADGEVDHTLVDSQGNLYAAGAFGYIDGVELNGLAQWDGTSWTEVGSPTILPGFNSMNALTIDANDTLYVAGSFRIGASSISALASWNGSTWTDLSASFSGSFDAIAVADNGTIYAAGRSFTSNSAQTGVFERIGSAWVLLGELTANSSFVQVTSLAFDGSNNLIVGGSFEQVSTVSANSVASWDGSVWSALGAGLTNNFSNGTEPGTVDHVGVDSSGDVYVGGRFNQAGGISVTGSNIAKWSGGVWSAPFDSATDTIFNIETFEFDTSDNLFVAGNVSFQQDSASVFSWNGVEWDAVGQSLSSRFNFSPVRSMTFTSDGTLFAAGTLSGEFDGNQFNGIAEFNDSSWVSLANYSGFGSNDEVFDFAQAPNGDVFVAGRFSSIGNQQIISIARWDGTSWSALNDGGTDVVASSVVVATNGDVYAAGNFNTDTGEFGSVAIWDGNVWSVVGGSASLNGNVTDIVVDDSGDIYASGQFFQSGNQFVGVFIWDGNVWAPLGDGVSNPSGSGFVSVNAITLDASGDLLIAGTFTEADNVPALNVARWDGSSWTALGAGLQGDSSVRDITETPDGNIAVVGELVSDPANFESAPLAIWDGTVWNYINGPVSNFDRASALTITAQGEIVVAGGLAFSFSPRSEGMAAWDGTQWRGFGSAIGRNASSVLALPDNSIFVGGRFSVAGSEPSSNIARWIEPNTPVVALCNGLTITVNIALGETATSGDDVILGTPGNDIISAFGGNDTVCGLGGSDTIFAGNGDDWVDAGAGDDEVQGSNGIDFIIGGTGDDMLAGGPNADSIFGGNGDDTLFGNSGADLIDGGNGVDQIKGGSGNDVINTGAGATFGSGVFVDGGAGDDTITGGPDADVIRGTSGDDTIFGGDGDDQLFGSGGEDEIHGEAGNDLIRGNAGDDVLSGGEGNDNINGFGSKDTISGGAGDDILDGSTGNDFIQGDSGNDTVRGGGGNDQLFGDSGADLLQGGGGNDELNGGGDSPDICDGQSGVDTATASCETVIDVP